MVSFHLHLTLNCFLAFLAEASFWQDIVILTSRQLCNSRLQTRFSLVSAAWPARSCAVFRQVFVERRRYRHSSLRLAAPLPRQGLAEALEGLAMLCWVYNNYVLKFKILSRRLKQIMLTYMVTVTNQHGWVYNNTNYFRYSIYIARRWSRQIQDMTRRPIGSAENVLQFWVDWSCILPRFVHRLD